MTITEKTIETLEKKGFNRWTKAGMDRLYINANSLGLKCEYHKTGNIRAAWFGENSISNSEARRMKCSKTYIDIATGMVISDDEWLKKAAETILAEAM